MHAGIWKPEREVEIAAGTPPGGGLDRTARALAKAIDSERLLDVPVRVVNIPGDGARKVWSYVAQCAGNAHVLSISSPNLTTDHLTGLAAFDHSAFTPLAILYTEYIAFVARADAPLATGTDLLQRLSADAASVTVALSTALGNPNHIALAKVVRHAGGNARAPRIRVFDSALDAVADVLAGHADIAAVTAASAVSALEAGRLRTLAVSAPGRLPGLFGGAPTWVEQGVDCIVGAWRGVSGPARLAPAAVAFWERTLAAAAACDEWKAELARHCWMPAYLAGDALRDALAREHAELAGLLAELGLVRAPGTAAP